MELEVMKTRNIICAFLTLIAVGCVKENEMPSGDKAPAGGNSITVNMPELTRTAIGDETQTGVSLVWSKGDEIAIIEGKGTEAQKHSIYRLVGEGGTASGTFEYVSGDASAEVITDVVFPASAVENNYAVPTAQTYVEGSFDADAMVMSWTRASEDEEIVLKHEAAVFMVTLTGSADQTISSIAVACGQSTYTLTCEAPVALSAEGKVFYIAVPGSTASLDYTFTISGSEGESMTKEVTYALNAGKIGRMPAIPFETTPAVEPLKLGDYFGGGIVFQLTDEYAKVVSLDEGLCYWAVDGQATTYIGTEANSAEGAANTDLFRSRSDLADFPAMAWCIEHGEGWYMPSRSEINYIVNGLGLSSSTIESVNQKFEEYYGVGFQSGKSYYTSCENGDGTKVWTVTIPAKSHNSYIKNYSRPVRAVKKIALTGGETADPKPTVQIAVTKLSPSKDASFASSVSNSHTKGSTGPELAVRYSGTSQYRLGTFFEFDISGIDAESCTEAVLKLSFHTNKMEDPSVETMILEIRETTDYTWEETADVKWPATSSTDITTATVTKGDTNVSIDLTSLVNTHFGNESTKFAIRIRAQESEGNKNSKNYLYIYSKEHETESLRPYLQVTTITK